MEKSKETKNNDKIVIDKSFDLLKLSFTQMKSSKLSDFTGNYFNELYEEALKIEQTQLNPLEYLNSKTINNSTLIINKITFAITYPTVFGEELGIIGSIPLLGEWSQAKYLKMKWTPGNKWMISLDISQNIKEFEYKFIIIEKGHIKKWQSGDNYKLSLNELLTDIQKKKVEYDDKGKEVVVWCKWK